MDSRQLTHRKYGHTWVWRFTRGHEPLVLCHAAELASSNVYDFNWFDVALIAYQLRKALTKEIP